MTGLPDGEPDARVPFLPWYQDILDGLGLTADFARTEEALVRTRFLAFLFKEFARLMPFDAAFYEAQYGDIAAAMARGDLTDSHAHYVNNGFREGRLPRAPLFDADYYLATYPDLAALAAREGAAGLLAHYIRHGRDERRFADKTTRMAAERWRQMLPLSPRTLAHRSVRDAVVRAFRPPAIAADRTGFRGGPVLGDDTLDDLLRHRRRGRVVDQPPRDGAVAGRLEGEFCYGGIAYAHFGHVMAETLHRVLPARRYFGCRRLIFVDELRGAAPSGFESLPAVQQKALLYLQVPPETVTVLHDDRVVDCLHVAQQGAELNGVPHAEYLAMLAEFTRDRMAALAPGGAAPARVYVSRSKLRDRGVLLGERYLERQLALEGWHIFHPEEHELAIQLRTYFSAETIIFAGGSACHGAELLGGGQMGDCFVLPRWDTQTEFYRSVLAPRSRRYATLPAACLLGSAVVDGQSGERQDQWGVSLPQTAALVQALRQHGLAELPYFSGEVFRRTALADFETYLALILELGRSGLPLIDEAGMRALATHVTAMLG